MNKKKAMALVLAATTALSPVTAFAAVEPVEGADVAKKSSDAAPDWQEYNNLIAQIKMETDTAKREELMHQAEDILMETNAIVPLYYYNDPYMLKENVKGVYSNVYGFKYFMFADPGEGKDALRIYMASEPDKLDPALNSTMDGGCLAANSFTGLCSYNDKGEVELALADKYEVSEDGLTYTFTMKDGLKWSDGSELTAKDFEYSWKRAADPKTAADYSYMYNGIATNEDGSLNVKASEDGKTFVVNLKAPCAYFLDLCTFPTFYPVPQASVEAEEGWETNPGLWAQEAGFVSNGAFVLKEWKHNESMVYEKNPNYYRADEVKVERLEFMLSDDDAAPYAAYQAGDLDFIDSIPTDETAAVLDSPEFHIVDQLGTYYMCFNVNSPLFEGKTPEQANAMRRAFSIIIDREYIAENIGQTGQVVANTFVPAIMLDGNGGEFRANDDAYTYPNEEAVGYFDPSYDAYEANCEEARKLLESAGYKFGDDGMLSDETPLTVTYVTNEGAGNVQIAEALQQDFAALGIDMVIDTKEWSVFLNERKAGNFDLARNGWVADFNDPINMLEMWTTESGNNDAQLGK
ncbi:MAG: ABC transporter substrate-binding protein [Eubacteriales bacterium]|nr:ABC transporter substrate-binding protein [Eubacteriales bacterium]